MCILLKRLLACWGCSLAILASAQARITVINRSLSTWTLRGAGTGPTAQCLVRLDGTGLGIGSSYTPGPADPLPLLPGLACDLTWDTPAGIVAFTLHDKTAGDSNPFLVNLVAHWGVAPRQGPSQMSLEVFSLASRYALRPADIQQKLGTLDGSGFIIHGDSYQVFQGASLVQQMLTLLARNVPLLPMGAGAPRADRSPLPATPGSLPSLDGASVASKEESAASPGAPMDLEPAPSAGAGSRKRPRGEDRAEGPARKRARKEAKAPVAEDPFASDADDSDSPPAAGAARSRRNGSRQSIHIRNESGEAWTLRAALRKDVAVETRPNAEGQGGPETSTWATARKKMKPDVEVAFTIADGTTAKFDLSAPSNRIRRGEVDRLCFFHLAGADGAAAAGARFQVESVIVRVGEASAGGEPARGGKVKRTLPRILLDQTSPAFARLALGEGDSFITILPPASPSGAAPEATAAGAGPAPAPDAGAGSGSGQGAGAGSAPAQPAPRPAPETLTIRNDSIWDWRFSCEAPARPVLAEGTGPGQEPALLTPDRPGRWDIPAGATATFRAAAGAGWVEMAFRLVSEDLRVGGLEPVPFSWEAAGPVSAQAPPRVRCLLPVLPAEVGLEGDRTIVLRDPDCLPLEDFP